MPRTSRYDQVSEAVENWTYRSIAPSLGWWLWKMLPRPVVNDLLVSIRQHATIRSDTERVLRRRLAALKVDRYGARNAQGLAIDIMPILLELQIVPSPWRPVLTTLGAIPLSKLEGTGQQLVVHFTNDDDELDQVTVTVDHEQSDGGPWATRLVGEGGWALLASGSRVRPEGGWAICFTAEPPRRWFER